MRRPDEGWPVTRLPFGICIITLRSRQTLSMRVFGSVRPASNTEKSSTRQEAWNAPGVTTFGTQHTGQAASGRSVMKLRTATLAAALLAASIPSLPSTAQARPFGFHGGWGHGGWGWGGAGLGLAAGAIIGSALAAPYYGGYGYPYGYGYAPYGYGADYGYDPIYGYAPVSYAYAPGYAYYGGYRRYGYGGYGAYRVGYGGYRAGYARAAYARPMYRAHLRYR